MKYQNHSSGWLFLFSFIFSAIIFVPDVWSQSADRKDNGSYTVVGASITGAGEIKAAQVNTESKLELQSSDTRLVEVFNWAKRQAMSFVFEDDPVGPWYEAAEPAREAFCMRDVSSQSMGAHALGLARHNFNMLRRFAENISDSRDWCSLWEIDRYNRPAPVDYENDAEFWYNLPANFDILNCCFRMYVWTGNLAYVNDPVFLNFYDHTVTNYVERWGLGIENIMKRPRLMNIRGMVYPQKKFQAARGIPGYDEGDPNYIVCFDVLSTQYTAYLAYAHIQETRRNKELAQTYLKKAADLKTFADSIWWNKKEKCFYSRLNKNYELEGKSDHGLFWGLGKYDNPDEANAQLLDLSKSRLEYPEVSFTKIGTIVNVTMGINIEFTSPLKSAMNGFWIETMVSTLSGLGTKIIWAELRNLPIRNNVVSVRHEGERSSAFTNQHGPALIWQAGFVGEHETLLVNGHPMKAQTEKNTNNQVTSFVRITVGGGGTVRVEIPKLRQ
jgi:hypothetical protein